MSKLPIVPARNVGCRLVGSERCCPGMGRCCRTLIDQAIGRSHFRVYYARVLPHQSLSPPRDDGLEWDLPFLLAPRRPRLSLGYPLVWTGGPQPGAARYRESYAACHEMVATSAAAAAVLERCPGRLKPLDRHPL